MPVTGFRFGSLAYITDIKDYPPSLFDFLSGVDTLIISAVRKVPSPLHLNLEEAVSFSKKVGASQTFFTHVSHEFPYEETNSSLCDSMQLAFDGLQLPFSF